MNIAEVIAEAVVAEDVRDIYGLMGDGNMLLMSYLEARPEVSVVRVRHEGTALTMAGAAAKATGRVAVCTVTCGPGLTQLGTALVDAVKGQLPVIVLAGDLDARDVHVNQWFAQAPFVASTGARHLGLTDPDSVPETLARAFHTARQERLPVVVGMPMSLQQLEYPWDWSYRPVPGVHVEGLLTVSDDMIGRLAELVSAARRPVIVGGAGAVTSGVGLQLRELGKLTGALLGTTLKAKGLFAGDPYDAGICGAFSTVAVRALLAEADLVLAIGASLNYYTTEGGYLFGDAAIVAVDSGAAQAGLDVDITLRVQADARTVLPALLEQIRAHPKVQPGYRTEQVRQDLAGQVPAELAQAASPERGLHPVEVVRAVDQNSPAEAGFVVGVGHFWSFPIMYLQGRDPGSYQVTQDFGSIGQGLPSAIGWASSTGRPIVLFEGDGSLIMHVQELETLARHPAPVLVIVMNDGSFGAEVHKLAAKGLATGPAIFGRPDFSAIAVACGIAGATVSGLEELSSAIKQWQQLPTVLDVPVDPSIVSAPYLRSVFGQNV
jgi:acetolactate synthase-1/2/3 large subunit